MEQDIGIIQADLHFLRIGDKVGRDIAPIELHPFNDLQFGFHSLGFFNGDHPILADFLHCFRDDVSNSRIVVCRNGADLGNLLLVADGLTALLQFIHNESHPLVDSSLQRHGVHTGDDKLGSFTINRLGEHGSRRGAVARLIRSLGGNFFDHLRPHVFEFVFQLNLFGHGNAVLGDLRGAPGFGDSHIPSFGSQGDFYRIGQRINALHYFFAGLHVIFYFLCRHSSYLLVL